MTDRLRHRGPDGRHTWHDARDDVAIGQVHLRAFAPAPGVEPAPLVDPAGIAVGVDGAVFSSGSARDGGAAALRRAFQSTEPFPSGVYGPHAFAIWDRASQSLTLARDALGEKPLYYYEQPGTGRLIFASEIKSILAHPAVTPVVDPVGLGLFLTFGWLPAPQTMFAGVRKLFPGELLTWRRGAVSTQRYWKLPPLEFDDADLATFSSHAKERYLRALERHVHGMSEVGLFLSGGMDSTILVIALKELGVPRLRTFTLGLAENSPDQCNRDTHYARLVADHFGTIHEELQLDAPDPRELLPAVARQFDDPILTPNCFTKYLLAALARRAGVDAVLTGSGAGGGCGPYRNFRDRRQRRKIARKLQGIENDVDRFLRLRGKVLSRDEQREILPADAILDHSAYASFLQPYLSQIRCDDYPRAYLLANLLTTCPEKVCMVLDRGGAMASVDVRSPHLDRELVEFQLRVPSSLDGGRSFVGIKCLLNNAFADQIPQAVLERDETGFPCYYWNRGELGGFQEKFFSGAHAGLFQPDAARRVIDRERLDSTSKSVGKKAWALTLLELWHAIHVQRDPHWLAAAEAGSAESFLKKALQPA